MALGSNEAWVGGFVCDVSSVGSPVVVVTYNATGATNRAGFLRDPDGRLVVVSA